jgi:hypothetical protein
MGSFGVCWFLGFNWFVCAHHSLEKEDGFRKFIPEEIVKILPVSDLFLSVGPPVVLCSRLCRGPLLLCLAKIASCG